MKKKKTTNYEWNTFSKWSDVYDFFYGIALASKYTRKSRYLKLPCKGSTLTW